MLKQFDRGANSMAEPIQDLILTEFDRFANLEFDCFANLG
jgi:hypothetical protein